MKRCFCTIITLNYLPYALTLYESLFKWDESVLLMVLISDGNYHPDIAHAIPTGIRFFAASEVCNTGIGQRIFNKYAYVSEDRLRWSLKPIFINYLIEQRAYEKILYSDCDLYFFDKFNFLFDELEKVNVLLSPHYRCSTPFNSGVSEKERENFQLLFSNGLFNGGFIGVNNKGTAAMNWWALACEYICEVDSAKGFFDDQTHLNLLPVIFEDVGMIRNRGCNIANWNQTDCKRTEGKKNEVLINNQWEVIFIHFTKSTINGILSGEDRHLTPFLEEYASTLKKYKPDFDIDEYKRRLIKDERKRQSIFFRIMNKFRTLG